MGRDKAWLPFGEETLLQRVVRIAAEATAEARVVVVAAAGQDLPQLPPAVRVVRDEIDDAGPLPALAAGLAAAAQGAAVAFVSACDVPRLTPAAVEFLCCRLANESPEVAALIPVAGGESHPLTAAYRTSAAARLQAVVAAGERSVRRALESLAVTPVDEAVLRRVDPQLAMFACCNTPAEYAAAMAAASDCSPWPSNAQTGRVD